MNFLVLGAPGSELPTADTVKYCSSFIAMHDFPFINLEEPPVIRLLLSIYLSLPV